MVLLLTESLWLYLRNLIVISVFKRHFLELFWRTTRLAMFIPLCWCEGKHFYSRYHQNWEAYTRWINSATGQKKIFISCIFWFWTRLNFMYSVIHLFFFYCCCFSVCNLQGKYEYVKVISEELETHATVYQPPGHTLHLPSFIRNHGLLTQEHFQQLLHKAKV